MDADSASKNLVLDCKNKRYSRQAIWAGGAARARSIPAAGCDERATKPAAQRANGYIAYFCNQALDLSLILHRYGKVSPSLNQRNLHFPCLICVHPRLSVVPTASCRLNKSKLNFCVTFRLPVEEFFSTPIHSDWLRLTPIQPDWKAGKRVNFELLEPPPSRRIELLRHFSFQPHAAASFQQFVLISAFNLFL
jgi:hypothetical protein